ncbi:HNH endonuclease family protein [Nocardioides sp. Leaf285]|uniref:HNH endonuclease family protein n=1 Tax=Nocardioides sp. Leaf285 TaxID=1736322 RepID=UPI0009E8DE68|nr:HNH endonuclease family protein [Nocardioides sp. Leaf285]
MVRRLLPSVLVSAALAAGAVALPSAAHAADYSAPLRTAVSDLPTATEVRTGYSRDLFTHWIDADGDGCSTRDEVLISEADDPVTVGAGCALSGGRWYSYYDGASWTATSDVDIDHMVPLAEAWDSGARTWSSATRQAYANDLGDHRSLVGVTDNVNQAKSDQDPAEWLPAQQVCRYVSEYVAVKHRWRLSVDAAEKAALASAADGCTNTTLTVALAR